MVNMALLQVFRDVPSNSKCLFFLKIIHFHNLHMLSAFYHRFTRFASHCNLFLFTFYTTSKLLGDWSWCFVFYFFRVYIQCIIFNQCIYLSLTYHLSNWRASLSHTHLVRLRNEYSFQKTLHQSQKYEAQTGSNGYNYHCRQCPMFEIRTFWMQ